MNSTTFFLFPGGGGFCVSQLDFDLFGIWLSSVRYLKNCEQIPHHYTQVKAFFSLLAFFGVI